jgi:hypothetical protein
MIFGNIKVENFTHVSFAQRFSCRRVVRLGRDPAGCTVYVFGGFYNEEVVFARCVDRSQFNGMQFASYAIVFQPWRFMPSNGMQR